MTSIGESRTWWLWLDKYHEDEDCDANATAGDWVLLKKAAMSED